MATKSLLMFLACTSLIVSCALPDVEINYESRFGMSGILRQGVPLEIYLFQTANPLGGNGFTSPSDYQIIVSRNGQIVDTMERLDSVRFTSWVVPVEDDTIIVEVVDLDSVVISSVPIVVPLPFQFSKKVFWPEIDLEKNTYGSLIVNVERLDEHGDMAMFSVENRRGRGSVTNTFELLNASYCFEGGYSLEDFRSYDFSCKPLRHEINVRSVGTNSIRINDSIKVVLCATDRFSSSYLETTVFENGDIPITKLLFDFDGTTPSNISNSVGAILSINCDTINGY